MSVIRIETKPDKIEPCILEFVKKQRQLFSQEVRNIFFENLFLSYINQLQRKTFV
jgi:hypothetical protein